MKRAAILTLLLAGTAFGRERSIIGSKHDLSASGPGPVKAENETRVCIFCHVAHQGGPRGQNRPDTKAEHRPYGSTRMASRLPGAPSGSSRTCLSCHDGTIAVGQTIASGQIKMRPGAPGGRLPAGPSNLGTDLRGSHPISFEPAAGAAVRKPAKGDAVQLDRAGRLQCTSCHDPHDQGRDPQRGRFLVKANKESALCLACHAPEGWSGTSSHRQARVSFDANPEAATGYADTLESGCANCHQPHGADQHGMILRRRPDSSEDETCLRCHDGRIAKTNLLREMAKPYSHAAPAKGPSGHDPAEGLNSKTAPLPETSKQTRRHASCVDCHQPHASYRKPTIAPFASGALAGVWGIDRNGAEAKPARYEHEVCFKCHGDSANQPQADGPQPPDTLRRAVLEVNLRRAFDASAPSYHPVEIPGRNPDVPSLIAPLTPASIIYCADCHGSDQAPDGPRGPHGSVNRHLLVRNLSTADRTPEGPGAYALCYRCHDRDVLLSIRSSFPAHRRHVAVESIPCTACHNSHGVSSIAGTPINNAHLVDFDVSIVKPAPGGLMQYATRGFRSGSCTLSCHGSTHLDRSYAPGSVPVAGSVPAVNLPALLKAR